MRALVFALLLMPALVLAAEPAGNAAKGKEIYTKVGCWQCHGREAQGGGYVGPRLAPDPIPLEGIAAYIRHPAGDMPPYTTKVLSESELRDIYAFLKSVPPPRPAASIAILKN